MSKAVRYFRSLVEQVDMAKKLKANYNPGSRIFPARCHKNDAAAQFRLDAGPLVDKRWRIVKWQVNSQATARSLKDWLKKNGTHAILASGRFDTAAKDEKKELTRMLDGMEAEALKKI